MAVNFGQNLFPASPPSTIATYDAFDIAQGVAIKNFYGGQFFSVSGAVERIDYKLSPILFHSNNVASGGNVTGSTFEKRFDENFDLEFERPINIGGWAIINIPHSIEGTPASNYRSKVTATLKKISDGITTNLYDPTSSAELITAQSRKTQIVALPMNLGNTHFKAGDILRLSVQQYIRGNATDTGNGYIAFDPQNRAQSGAWADGDSILTIRLPVKIDI